VAVAARTVARANCAVHAMARTSAYHLYTNWGVCSSLLLAVFSHSSSASPADVIKFKGRSANVFFESRSGCIGTIVNVFASERVCRSGGSHLGWNNDFIPDSSLAGNLFSTMSGDRARGC
jgi:hypothetical protein